jgi:hypothetical protein
MREKERCVAWLMSWANYEAISGIYSFVDKYLDWKLKLSGTDGVRAMVHVHPIHLSRSLADLWAAAKQSSCLLTRRQTHRHQAHHHQTKKDSARGGWWHWSRSRIQPAGDVSACIIAWTSPGSGCWLQPAQVHRSRTQLA